MSYGEKDQAIGRGIYDRGYRFPIVYDVGGSNGSWVNIMSKVLPGSRFELFEPLAEIHPKYKEILVYLKHVYRESYMHPVAIGEKDGKIRINVYDDPSASTTLSIAAPAGTQSVEVPMRSIDSIVASGMCAPPDLIKIDIQGGELAALKGAANTLKNVKFLMLETWLQRGYGKETPLLHELMEFLVPHGFMPYEFGDDFRSASGEQVSVDVWFINKAHAKNPAAF
ncbi:MAG: FkbM family methyltransferase [Hyphomicrobiaceae bacterium]